MDLALAIFLGLFFGLLQFGLLLLGVRSLAAGNMKITYFIVQFFCPLVGLAICTWLAPNWLLVCATIICAILFLGAIGHLIHTGKFKGKKD